MTPDGISTEDWDEVHDLAVRIVNLSSEGHTVESDQLHSELLALLDRLDLKYGPRPSLLATRADYVESPTIKEQCLHQAYAAALQLNDRQNLVWVASSLASFYIEDASDIAKGTSWLLTFRALVSDATGVAEHRSLERLERALRAKQK